MQHHTKGWIRVPAEVSQQIAAYFMQQHNPQHPHWRYDPTYDLKKSK